MEIFLRLNSRQIIQITPQQVLQPQLSSANYTPVNFHKPSTNSVPDLSDPKSCNSVSSNVSFHSESKLSGFFACITITSLEYELCPLRFSTTCYLQVPVLLKKETLLTGKWSLLSRSYSTGVFPASQKTIFFMELNRYGCRTSTKLPGFSCSTKYFQVFCISYFDWLKIQSHYHFENSQSRATYFHLSSILQASEDSSSFLGILK